MEAAEHILQAAGRPMTAGESTAEAIDRGLIETRGKTPDKTMLSHLYVRLRDDPDGVIQRDYVPGQKRARQGSVRWWYRSPRKAPGL